MEGSIKKEKRGRKTKNEYYFTKKPDNVILKKTAIITLPISLKETTLQANTAPEAHAAPLLLSANTVPISRTENKIFYILSPITEILNVNYRTDIHCYWCCHQFDWMPVFMPCEMKKKQFSVKGIFCSFECCLSYMSDSSKYNRNMYMLKYMYFLYTNKKFFRDTLIKAPEKECLKMFGGPLSIKEFRGKCHTYDIHAYPMIYIQSLMEKKIEVLKREHKSSDFSEFIRKVN